MIQHPYRHIWDCCCDHGQLGAALLAELKALSLATEAAPSSQNHAPLQTHASLQTSVHFVDIIPSLMQEVEDKLQRFFPQSKQGVLVDAKQDPSLGISWQVHCLDVSQLPIFNDDSRQLIIIAGVGGALTLKLVQAIRLAYPQQALDFLLCPVHHQFELRQGLKALNLGLVDEQLIVENRRFYELIYVSTQSNTELSAQGDKLWQRDIKLSQAYLNRTLTHYRNMQRPSAEIDTIIAAYDQIQTQLSMNPACET
jgi:tRNA (adenine22-N1)-methyltransferase